MGSSAPNWGPCPGSVHSLSPWTPREVLPCGSNWHLPVANGGSPLPVLGLLSLAGVPTGGGQVSERLVPPARGRCLAGPTHLLLLGGRKEAHHLHGLLESFKVVLQVLSVLDLQVMLKNKVSSALGTSGLGRVVCEDDFGWNRWGRAGGRQEMNGLLYAAPLWASLELVWGLERAKADGL